jgi:hypothetical protein
LDCFGGWAIVSVSNLHGDQGGVAWHLPSTMTSLGGHGATGSQRLAREDVRAQGGGAIWRRGGANVRHGKVNVLILNEDGSRWVRERRWR